ncbi:phospholipid scramblase family member 5 [Ctenodactylus gundi]
MARSDVGWYTSTQVHPTGGMDFHLYKGFMGSNVAGSRCLTFKTENARKTVCCVAENYRRPRAGTERSCSARAAAAAAWEGSVRAALLGCSATPRCSVPVVSGDAARCGEDKVAALGKAQAEDREMRDSSFSWAEAGEAEHPGQVNKCAQVSSKPSGSGQREANAQQSRKSKGQPHFLPGSPDPDPGRSISPSHLQSQVWQSGSPPPTRFLPTVSFPPGLEYLSQLDLIIIHQQVELLGMILGTETANKYEIKNALGQRIYFAVEESVCFNRTFCSTLRSCTLRITDNSGRGVITVNRPLRCNSCWCPCFLQELEIQAPPGTTVAYVAQKWDPFHPKFMIQNADKENILKIVGPCATCGCFGDVDFEVRTLNEKLTIGKISKYWSGFVNNVFTNAANFGIHVPADLDVTIKAAMIGACILFDFMFFEHSLAGL